MSEKEKSAESPEAADLSPENKPPTAPVESSPDTTIPISTDTEEKTQDTTQETQSDETVTVTDTNIEVNDPEPTPPVPTKPLIIDLLRHGQVATSSLFSAPVDEPLGMEGWKQLTIATQDGHWDAVITPSTRRCHDFARLLSQRLDCHFHVDDRYSELDFGEWVGLSQEEILSRDPELLQQYYFQPRRFHAPGGESMSEFSMRVHAAWDDLLAQYAGQHVLVLTKAGVIRTIIAKALGLLYQKALRFDVDYARFTRLKVYPDGEAVLTGHGLPAVETV